MVPRKLAEEAAHGTRGASDVAKRDNVAPNCMAMLPESMVRVMDVVLLFTMNTSVTLTIHFGNIAMRFGWGEPRGICCCFVVFCFVANSWLVCTGVLKPVQKPVLKPVPKLAWR